jgi:hypothetical protein
LVASKRSGKDPDKDLVDLACQKLEVRVAECRKKIWKLMSHDKYAKKAGNNDEWEPDEEELDKVVVDNKTANNKTAEEVNKGQNSS